MKYLLSRTPETLNQYTNLSGIAAYGLGDIYDASATEILVRDIYDFISPQDRIDACNLLVCKVRHNGVVLMSGLNIERIAADIYLKKCKVADIGEYLASRSSFWTPVEASEFFLSRGFVVDSIRYDGLYWYGTWRRK